MSAVPVERAKDMEFKMKNEEMSSSNKLKSKRLNSELTQKKPQLADQRSGSLKLTSDDEKFVAEEEEKEGKLVCITGLVGSGKQFVADFLTSEGFHIGEPEKMITSPRDKDAVRKFETTARVFARGESPNPSLWKPYIRFVSRSIRDLLGRLSAGKDLAFTLVLRTRAQREYLREQLPNRLIIICLDCTRNECLQRVLARSTKKAKAAGFKTLDKWLQSVYPNMKNVTQEWFQSVCLSGLKGYQSPDEAEVRTFALDAERTDEFLKDAVRLTLNPRRSSTRRRGRTSRRSLVGKSSRIFSTSPRGKKSRSSQGKSVIGSRGNKARKWRATENQATAETHKYFGLE